MSMTQEKMYMNVDDVCAVLGVSKAFAYKIMKGYNEELKERGFLLNPAYEDGSSDMVSSVSTGNASSASAPVLPAAYDLRQSGRVSPVKNQGEQGLCWTFSTYASLESFLLFS